MRSWKSWISALSVIIGTVAYAESPKALEREVGIGWSVLPTAVSDETKVVHKGDIVLRQQLVASGYAVLREPAIDGNKTLLPTGADLIKLTYSKGVLECSLAEAKKTLFERINMSSDQVRYCLLDGDGDGAFESYIRYRGAVRGLPSFNGRVPNHVYPLKRPAAYVVRDPAELSRQYFLGIKYEGHSALSGSAVFVDVFGSDESTGSLDHAWPRSDGGRGHLQSQGTVLLRGAEIKVIADQGNDLSVQIVKPFPPGIFSIVQSGKNGFF